MLSNAVYALCSHVLTVQSLADLKQGGRTLEEPQPVTGPGGECFYFSCTGRGISPSSPPVLWRLTRSHWDHRSERRSVFVQLSTPRRPDRKMLKYSKKKKGLKKRTLPKRAASVKGQRQSVRGRLRSQLSLLVRSQGSSCQPGTASVQSEAVLSWRTISLNIPAGTNSN